MFSESIFKFIVEVITVGGSAAAIAYGAFIYFGKKWLDDKFSKNLEAFKHQQNLQMEQYRFEINSLFNRIIKVHEKEFEVLPTMWFKLQEALGRVLQFTNPFQTYPDLNRMNDAQVEETLKKSKLTESEKDAIRKVADKNQKYIKTIFWHNLNETRQCGNDFHNYLLFNKIFLSKD